MKQISERELIDLEEDGDEIFGGDGKRIVTSKMKQASIAPVQKKPNGYLSQIASAIITSITEWREIRKVLEKMLILVSKEKAHVSESKPMVVDFEVHRDMRGYINKITATRRTR